MNNSTSQVPKRYNDLPGPRGLPLLGNALQIQPDRFHQVVENWGERHGCPYRFSLGPQKAIVLSDPAQIAEAMRDRPNRFRRFAGLEQFAEELCLSGLFSSEGENWQRHRRAWMQALSVHHVKPFFEQLSQITQRLQRRWEQAADNGSVVDVQADLMRYTVDITTLFAFGIDNNTLEEDGSVIQDHLGKIFYMLQRRLSMPFPYWRWFKLPIDRRLDRSLAEVQKFVHDTIAVARQRIADNPELAEKPTNLLEALIVARDEDGKAFSDREIAGNTVTALLAGEDTTANTLAWMIHLLCEHPEEQRKLQQEIDSALGDAPMWEHLEDGDKLKVIDHVMSETLRLKPVAPFLFLCAKEDTVIADVQVKAGTNVILALRKAGFSEEEFPQYDKFSPDRWQENKKPFAIRPPMPFGGGPRMCPGRSLAQMEIKSVTSMLMKNFSIEAAGDSPVTEKLTFTLMPANLKVRMHRRR